MLMQSLCRPLRSSRRDRHSAAEDLRHRPVCQVDQESRRGNPEDPKEGERTDRYQGIGHRSSTSRSVGSASGQADTAERAAAAGRQMYEDHQFRFGLAKIHNQC